MTEPSELPDVLDAFYRERLAEAHRAKDALKRRLRPLKRNITRLDRRCEERQALITELKDSGDDEALARAQQGYRRAEKSRDEAVRQSWSLQDTLFKLDGFVERIQSLRAGHDAEMVQGVAECEAIILREERQRQQKEGLSSVDCDQQCPDPLQLARRGVDKILSSGAVRLGPEMPDAVVRMVRAELIGEAEARALARWRDDLAFGSGRGRLVQSWDVPVDGGGAGAGNVAVSRIEALERYRLAAATLQPAQQQVLAAVLFEGIALTDAPGLVRKYRDKSQRTAAAGALIIGAAQALRTFYDAIGSGGA
ncbi:hypothetical protein [Maricaulis maris]|uniref:hypothetical protein n=1 Tax=Maricaulis maris TaxID=74318 RepID=UPI003B8BC61A